MVGTAYAVLLLLVLLLVTLKHEHKNAAAAAVNEENDGYQRVGSKFRLCGDGENLFGITSVTLDPEPLIRGKTVRSRIDAIPTVDLPTGHYDVKMTVYALGVDWGSMHFNMCKDFEGITCPVKAGEPVTGYFTYPVDRHTVSGVAFTVKVEITDKHSSGSNSRQLACYKVDTKVKAANEDEDEYDGYEGDGQLLGYAEQPVQEDI